ncbi:MAG: twin-arginine translocase TatA/TatE family subunit, partial [Phycisphaerales bacterium]|nr:twin-arginine translocase TatA/TatE family subunit [Phycisphaerales bacterium]
MVLTETFSTTLAIFGLPGGGEWIVILVLGLLIFGRRLPEIGRSAGKAIVEFKKGVKG